MTDGEFALRTRQFAIAVIAFIETLPRTNTGSVIGKQLLRSATSVAANYCAACRAKSTPHMVAKLALVEEEADE